MASSSSSTPVSSSHSWNHQVFLSFRGEDTRKTFVDHLYMALVQQGISTYKDDETLARGESIRPALMKAIRESRIAVIVFSENYADSSWCLDELEYIMKCRDETGQIVIPIFYHVDPSEVRKQNGRYGEAFAKHELMNNNKVDSWRRALFDAGSLSGWVPEDVANGRESKFIKEIVDTISNKLFPLISSIDENLVGLRTRSQNLKSKLEIWSGGVRIVGIWGVGGGGKTTLATSVYDEICSKFDGCCFVENIREQSNKKGLEELQANILSDVLKHEKLSIGRVHEGRRLMKSRLCYKKVLIVLDDVDHLDQLDALAGSCDWFGEGSRIIITTRDEHVLKAHKVNVIHSISLLDDKEAIELFCKHNPPRVNIPIGEYEPLSKEVVSYAGGLPLALKVLGCFLCDKDTHEWRSALARLKAIPDTNILEKLKISYEGLTSEEKKLFLDIACFFRWGYNDKATEIFEACGFHPVIGIKVLTQKALITVTEDGGFDMHDLVLEMAIYIVRGEHPDNPEKHSRVWDEEDIRKLCAMDETTALDNIEAIRVDSRMENPFPYHHHDVVANMKKLRWIEWSGMSGSSLPTNFPSAGLRCLILSNSLHRHLWKGSKNLPNLRMIKLHNLEYLIETPDFGGLPNLERFEVEGCWKLAMIHPSIGGLEKLAHLKVYDCSNVYIFPPITRSQKLETFKISGYNGFDVEYFLDGVSIPPNIFNFLGLHVFHRDVRNLTLRCCYLQDGDFDSVVCDFPNLMELDLSYNDFSRLNLSILKLPQLKCLDLTGCDRLVELSGLPSSIAVLFAICCDSLETVGDISNCKWLWRISLHNHKKVSRLLGHYLILQAMLQGINAVEKNFISFSTGSIDAIPKRLVDRLAFFINGEIKLQLPHNWSDNFCGFLMCIATADFSYPSVKINVKQELVDREYSQFEVNLEETPKLPRYGLTCVGYVSFNSLMKDYSTPLNSAYNTISFEVDGWDKSCWFVADLVPKKSKVDDAVHTSKIQTDSSEFYDKKSTLGKRTFTIQHGSNSSIIIDWHLLSMDSV